MRIPESTKHSLTWKLVERQRQRWPPLTKLAVARSPR